MIDYAPICGMEHEYTDPDTGLGVVIASHDGGEYESRACANCTEIRDDFEWWLRNRQAVVA